MKIHNLIAIYRVRRLSMLVMLISVMRRACLLSLIVLATCAAFAQSNSTIVGITTCCPNQLEKIDGKTHGYLLKGAVCGQAHGCDSAP